MSEFKFHIPVTVRYGDLDPQWHVNNARFLSYSEHARSRYLVELGLFDGKSFWDLPLIVGDIHCRFLLPIEPGATVIVSMGVRKIGNKTLTIESEITGADGTPVYARLETIMVAYDYHRKSAVPVSDEIRRRISDFEGIDFSGRQG
jgi:acyl-CoA thioester hydrolase